MSIGSPLTAAGPLGLLIGIITWSLVVFCASNCLVEMTTLLPIDGGFITFAGRFIDDSVGKAIGWNVSRALCFSFAPVLAVLATCHFALSNLSSW